MRKANRNAFTLVELLIVIFIIALVSVATLPTILPALSHRQVSESARLLQAVIEGARDASLRANAPRGIRLLPDPAFPGSTTDPTVPLAYNRIVLIEPAPDYSDGKVSVVAGPNPTAAQVPIPFSSPAAPYPDTALRLVESRVDGAGLPNARVNWAWNARVGDRIRIGAAGAYYQIAGPMVVVPAAGNPEKFVNYGPPGTTPPMTDSLGNDVEFLYLVNGRDDNGNGYVDDGWDGAGWDGKDTDGDGQVDEATDGPPFDFNGDGVVDARDPMNWREWEPEAWAAPTGVDQPYTIKRLPVPTQGGRVVELPSNIVVDATTWATTAERSRLPVDAGTLYAEIMVAPNGTIVQTPYLPGRAIPGGAPFFHFFLAERSDVYPAAATGSPRLPLPDGTVPGATTTLKGDRRAVTINTRSGNVTTSTIEDFDTPNPSQPFDVNRPFYAAQSGSRDPG